MHCHKLVQLCQSYLEGSSGETMNPGPSLILIAFIVTITAATLLLLLLLRYCYFHITFATSASPCVAELITQLLSLTNILWLPLCRINKLGYTSLEDCCNPL